MNARREDKRELPNTLADIDWNTPNDWYDTFVDSSEKFLKEPFERALDKTDPEILARVLLASNLRGFSSLIDSYPEVGATIIDKLDPAIIDQLAVRDVIERKQYSWPLVLTMVNYSVLFTVFIRKVSPAALKIAVFKEVDNDRVKIRRTLFESITQNRVGYSNSNIFFFQEIIKKIPKEFFEREQSFEFCNTHLIAKISTLSEKELSNWLDALEGVTKVLHTKEVQEKLHTLLMQVEDKINFLNPASTTEANRNKLNTLLMQNHEKLYRQHGKLESVKEARKHALSITSPEGLTVEMNRVVADHFHLDSENPASQLKTLHHLHAAITLQEMADDKSQSEAVSSSDARSLDEVDGKQGYDKENDVTLLNGLVEEILVEEVFGPKKDLDQHKFDEMRYIKATAVLEMRAAGDDKLMSLSEFQRKTAVSGFMRPAIFKKIDAELKILQESPRQGIAGSVQPPLTPEQRDKKLKELKKVIDEAKGDKKIHANRKTILERLSRQIDCEIVDNKRIHLAAEVNRSRHP